MSIISDAFAARRRCREDFELYVESRLFAAHEACNGVLLNRRGLEAGIDPRSLFMGSADRAFLYASGELMSWWDENRRTNYRQFEETWAAQLV